MTKRTTCQNAQAQLPDYVEHGIDPARRAMLQAHLDACPRCRRELHEIETLRTMLAGADVADPGTAFWDTFPDRVWQSYRAERSAPQRLGFIARIRQTLVRRHIATPRVWVPAMAIAALVAIFVGWYVPQSANRSDIAAFQARIHGGGESLALLARRNAQQVPVANQFAFSAAPQRVNYFRIGHVYAESLVYAANGDLETARQRLTAIAESLGDGAEVAQLARNEPSRRRIEAIEPELARLAAAGGTHALALFRAGAWLNNAALAAAARDRTALRAAAPEIQRLRHELDSADTSPGALRELGALAELLANGDLSDHDYARIARLIRDVQSLLL